VLHKPFAVQRLLDVLDRVKPRGMVLVADDDPDFAGSLAPLLQQQGYRVEIARDGRDALGKVEAGAIDCLILDMRMPLLSGLEVYMSLKEAARLVPTIFVTGFAEEEAGALDTVRAFTKGLLIKPFDPAELLRMIEAALAQKDRAREPAG
jgi:DNA-binding response OmpR family regulator